jgi:hypothetical protein
MKTYQDTREKCASLIINDGVFAIHISEDNDNKLSMELFTEGGLEFKGLLNDFIKFVESTVSFSFQNDVTNGWEI